MALMGGNRDSGSQGREPSSLGGDALPGQVEPDPVRRAARRQRARGRPGRRGPGPGLGGRTTRPRRRGSAARPWCPAPCARCSSISSATRPPPPPPWPGLPAPAEREQGAATRRQLHTAGREEAERQHSSAHDEGRVVSGDERGPKAPTSVTFTPASSKHRPQAQNSAGDAGPGSRS